MSAFYGGSAEAVAYVQATWIGNCCTISAACLILYDYLATFSEEHKLMWGRGLNCPTIIFHTNRWATLSWVIIQLLHINPGSPRYEAPLLLTLSSCVPLQRFGEGIQVLCLCIWAVFSAIRAYALSGRRWPPTLLVLALALVPVGTNVYGYFVVSKQIIGAFPGIGRWCIEHQDIGEAADTRFTLLSRICAIVADLVVLATTWTKTYGDVRRDRQHGIKMPLSTMLLRDGTVYFMIVLSINIIQTAGNATNIFTNTVVFNTPITSIIISRFLLNLRGVAYKQRGDGIDDSCPPFVMEQNNHEHEHDRPGSDNLRFASFIGNMGAELYYAGEDYDDKDHRNPSNVESDPEGINLQEHRDIQIGPQEDSSKITLPDRGKTSSTV